MKYKKPCTIEFCFKGSRNYVQGPDIIDKVAEIYSKEIGKSRIQNIKYSGHKMLRTNARLQILSAEEEFSMEGVNSIINFQVGDASLRALIAERKEAIECSKPFDESIITSKIKHIDDKEIYYVNSSDFSLTEICVSMNKYLLQSLESEGKWIVTKLELDRYLNLSEIAGQKIEIKLLHNFKNKLTKSSISLSERSIGFVYFTLLKD